MQKCDRCGKEGVALTMSWFNTEMICVSGPGSCDYREHQHPQFGEAKATEEAAVAKGDYGFPGIGKPDDL